MAAGRLARPAAGSRCTRSRRRPRRGCARSAAAPGSPSAWSTSTSSMLVDAPGTRARHVRASRHSSTARPEPAASSASTMASALAVAFGRSSQATRPDATTTTTAADPQRGVERVDVRRLAPRCAIAPPRAPPTAAAVLQRLGERVRRLRRESADRVVDRRLRKCDATRLPNTATPSAPPSSRVVSFTAEPTPALCSGSDRMIAPVDGAVVMPMPSACDHEPRARTTSSCASRCSSPPRSRCRAATIGEARRSPRAADRTARPASADCVADTM